MSASSRQWCVSDHEDRMEVVNNNVGQGRPVFEMLHRLDQTVLINHSCNEKTKHIHQNGYQLQILSNQYSSLQTLRSESQFKGHTDRILTIILYMYYFIPALITTVHRHNFLCNNHSPLPPPPQPSASSPFILTLLYNMYMKLTPMSITNLVFKKLDFIRKIVN